VSHFCSEPTSTSMRMNVESNAVAIMMSVAQHVMAPTLEGNKRENERVRPLLGVRKITHRT
jgi:hypothetical protein